MSEPRRLDAPPIRSATADREEQIEALLVAGLDHYFEGRYDEAVHLWTRVLFLDRAHARARAYIDRARSAQAERHRRADQILHETGQSLEVGDTDRARQLLSEVIDATGDDARTADLRARLDRLELAHVRSDDRSGATSAVVDAVPLRGRLRPDGWPLVAAGFTLAAAAVIALISLGDATWLGLREPPPPGAGLEPVETTTVPSSGEVALIRAETLFSRGRPAEALRVLERVELGSADQEVADRLRERIQEVLLALAGDDPPEVAGTASGTP